MPGKPSKVIDVSTDGDGTARLYYPKESLKMKLCVDGRKRLYEYCVKKQIPHRKTGKLVVSLNDAQSAYLEKLHATASAFHTPTKVISGNEARAMEPDLSAGMRLIQIP